MKKKNNLGDLSFIRYFLQELCEQNVAVFAGPGLSNPEGREEWKELLYSAAQSRRAGGTQQTIDPNLNKMLLRELTAELQLNESHKILAQLPVKTYWTTNYDRLIETALKEAGKKPAAKYATEQLASSAVQQDAVVYKLHGDVHHMNQTIMDQDEYERQLANRKAFIAALSGDLVSKTFLFLGFDPNDAALNYILNRVYITSKEHSRQHYLIYQVKKQAAHESDENYAARLRQQETAIERLQHFNINTMPIADHGELLSLLSLFLKQYRRRTVFISGSAHEFGEWGNEIAQSFLRALSGELVNRDYKIVTGVGRGVGASIVEGALERIYDKPNKKIGNQLIMRPFPQSSGESQCTQIWHRYRAEMSSHAGISLFVFGNKLQDGVVVNSDGVYEEFKLACEMDSLVVPIGATGYQAKKLWEIVMENFGTYFPHQQSKAREVIAYLGTSNNPEETIRQTIYTVELLTAA